MIPGDSRRWIERELGGRVVATRRLHGGIVSTVHEVRVEKGGTTTAFVLRRYENNEYERDPAGAYAHEARILTALERVDVPAPRLVAVGPDALVMTKLRGKVDLQPSNMAERLRQIAAPLPVLHGAADLCDVGLTVRLRPRTYEWVSDSGLRRAAEDLVAAPPRRIARVPTHGDYQHFNMLWSRGRMTGIVDWSGIWIGPPEIDVCHCRLNMAVLYGPDVADEFRDAYEAESGGRVDAWHDVYRIGNYNAEWPNFIPVQVHGRARIAPGMTARVEELLRRALSR